MFEGETILESKICIQLLFIVPSVLTKMEIETFSFFGENVHGL